MSVILRVFNIMLSKNLSVFVLCGMFLVLAGCEEYHDDYDHGHEYEEEKSEPVVQTKHEEKPSARRSRAS